MNEIYYFVYILASGRNGTLYVGMTSNLAKRIWEHKNNVIAGFTKTYAVHRLVYYEMHTDVQEALRREKSIKRWGRQQKMQMIESNNPEWDDLYFELNQ
ncbi:MAG: GIY-YIG nuclease family protein [Rickettsiales bacterium]